MSPALLWALSPLHAVHFLDPSSTLLRLNLKRLPLPNVQRDGPGAQFFSCELNQDPLGAEEIYTWTTSGPLAVRRFFLPSEMERDAFRFDYRVASSSWSG